ncbi:hypothetical protein FQN52_005734 [Onygenales sp. PD_12]|nr:hypothetical protein FQN52_005734 [Onygenales sp. PD_12]
MTEADHDNSYSKALDCSPTVDETRTIKLNRALTYLKTHRFEAALGDLKTVSPGDKPSEKALFREIQALYHLQRFREACNVHKVLSQEYPENTLAKSEFTRAIARLAEQEEGRYQFSQMQREAKECFPPHLDHATYIGPVCVKPTESHGRGLFTTKAVKAGDLLFCEKAFAYALADPINTIEGVPGVINGLTDRMGLAVNRPLVGLIEKRLSRSPSLLSTFADLYHGSYESVGALTVDGRPIVDSFLVEHIVGLNTTFSCPVLSYEDHIHTMNTKAKPENAAKYCGVWSLFSYINHSCYSNAHPSFIGDMMIVRAAQDMPPNTEIMHGYQSSLNTVMADHKIDMKEWGFECSCVMCKDSQQTKDTDMLKRKELRVSLAKELYLHGPPKMEKIDAIFSEFAGTYSRPASEVPRLGLWCLYSVVEIQWLPHNPQKAAEWAVKTLESLGYVIEGAHLPHVPGTSLLVKQWGLMLNTHMEYWMTLAAAYRLAAPDIVAQAEEYARITYRICIGEDETFDEAYLKG